MPAALLHLDGAQRAIEEDSFPELLQEPVSVHRWSYNLGALLPDLPLFTDFWKKVALNLAGRPYPESLWATLIHTRGAGSWAAALLGEALRTDLAELRALLAGFLTHIAFDRAMHPSVEEAVRRHLTARSSHSQLHENIENYQCMLWYRRRHGVDGLGSPLMGRISLGPRGAPPMPDRVAAATRASLGAAYGESPSNAELANWARGLYAYRRLLSSPAARIGIRGSERFGEEAPWVKDLTVDDYFQEGIHTSIEYLQAAAGALGDGDTAALRSAVGDEPLV